jgi:hypothetical protein
MHIWFPRFLFSAVLTVAFSGFSEAAQAEKKYAYPPQRFAMKGVRNIKIIGVKGTLRLHGRANKYMTLKVQHSSGHKAADDWNLSLDRRGNTLYLEVANVTYGRQWRHQVREDQWPEFDIDLAGPVRPTTVSWREGRLEFSKWNADLDVSFLKGRASVRGGTGALKIHQVEGDLSVRDHKGPIEVTAESGHLAFERVVGTQEIHWLKGEIVLRECRGDLRIESSESNLGVQGGGGQLSVEMPRGRAHILGFQGTVNAKGDQSHWEVSAAAPTDLNVITKSGPVGVEWNGGAKVFLTSTRGEIAAPKFLPLAEREGRKVRQGTAPGRRMGQVFVRTSSGRIHWRQ